MILAASAQITSGLDPSVIVAVITLISSVVVVVIANRFTSRSARDAAAKSVIVEQGKLDESRRQSLMDNMQEEIDRISAMRKTDREEFARELEKTNLRLTELVVEHDQYRRERGVLQDQVYAWIEWGRSAIRIMNGASLRYPTPPGGLTDPEGFPPVTGGGSHRS